MSKQKIDNINDLPNWCKELLQFAIALNGGLRNQIQRDFGLAIDLTEKESNDRLKRFTKEIEPNLSARLLHIIENDIDQLEKEFNKDDGLVEIS